MNRSEFVEALITEVYAVAVSDTLQDLREPHRSTQPGDLQNWFAQMDEDSRMHVASVVRLACDHAMFGFLAVLDGVRAIESAEDKGKLRLELVRDGGASPLNELTGPLLHDIFRAVMASRETQPDEHSRQTLDLHHVPAIETGLRLISGYNPETAPVIALPTREHRRIPSSSTSAFEANPSPPSSPDLSS